MLTNDVTQAAYHGDGPILPGESVHQAMGANTTYSIAGHLLGQPVQAVSSGPKPGHGFEDEPLNDAELASQKTVQSVNKSLQDGAQDGMSPAYSFNHAQAASNVRQALRPGV
jgi:hypothetical protein